MSAQTSRVVVKAMGVVAFRLPACWEVKQRQEMVSDGRVRGRQRSGSRGSRHRLSLHKLTAAHAAHPAAAQVPGHVGQARGRGRQGLGGRGACELGRGSKGS